MAWCVGSTFPNPDLLIDTGFETRLLNGLDPPQHLLDTGCTYQYLSVPEAEPRYQVHDFLKHHTDAFVSEELLGQHLEEDASLYLKNHQSSFNVGNRLEGIENGEGLVQLFYPAGRNIDRVESCLVSFDSKISVRICSGDATDSSYPSSLSVLQPILQITANKVEFPVGSKVSCVPLAVRTAYQVYFLTSEFQNGDIALGVKRVENFPYSTSHVVWNPHVLEEAAVILANGDLSIFDITSNESNATSFRFKTEDCQGPESFGDLYQTVGNERRKRSFSVPQFKISSKNLWVCEYSWHPKTLLVGKGRDIDLIDLRQKTGSKQFRCSLANAPGSSHLFSNCNATYKMEHFTALARGTRADMFQFAAGSTNHIILYDIRQPKVPVLQWEHRMQLEPPRLLQMVDFSDACSKLWDPLDRQLAGGRAILACAFRSGEIQAFPYGPMPQTYDQKPEGHVANLGVSDKVFSWGFPVKLITPGIRSGQNIEQMFQVHFNNLQAQMPADCEVDQLAGFMNSALSSDTSTITLLQLTGSGSILSQSLHLMGEQGCRAVEHHMSSSSKVPDVRTNYDRSNHYRVKNVPAFLRFMLNESVSTETEQRDYFTATILNVAPPLSIDHTLKTTEKETNELFKEHMPAWNSKEPEKISPQNEKLSVKGDQSAEQALQEICGQLSPVTLCFNSTGAALQSEEVALLKDLNDHLQQWQQSFQPYVTHLNLSSNK